MAGEDIIGEILVYLKKAGPTNTFRLSSVMGLERDKLLHILKRLEEKQAIKFECGKAIFIKFISREEPQPAEITKTSPKSEKRVKRKPAKSKALQLLQTENTQLQKKLSGLKETVKELEKKATARPKTITRTVTKTVVKKVPMIKTVVKRIFVHPSPLPPKKEKKNKKTPKLKQKLKKLKTSKKFRLPKIKLPKFEFPKFTFIKNIKQLKKPEFIEK